MGTETEQARTGTPRWLRVVLGLSLALNLLVVGLIGGAILRHGGSEGLRPPPRTAGAALYGELPREHRRAMWASARSGPQADQRMLQKADLLAISTAMRADPFDAMTLEALLADQAARRVAFQNTVRQAWLARVAGMSLAERQGYADRLERASARPWFGKRRDRRRQE